MGVDKSSPKREHKSDILLGLILCHFAKRCHRDLTLSIIRNNYIMRSKIFCLNLMTKLSTDLLWKRHQNIPIRGLSSISPLYAV